MSELYSYLNRSEQTTLRLPCARPRYDEARGGWFSFTPSDIDQGHDCLAGMWVGPMITFDLAAAIADEANQLTHGVMLEMRRKATAAALSRAPTMLTKGIDVSFIPGRIG